MQRLDAHCNFDDKHLKGRLTDSNIADSYFYD